MAKRANAKTVEMNASHVAYMSHPKETARHNGAHYNAGAAARANGRTREFLHQQLR
jgi:carboxymethylenebutenolidase